MANQDTTPTRGSQALAARRRERGLTLGAVARQVGAASDGTVHDHESGRRLPGRTYLVAYRDILGIPVDWWLEPAEERREQGAAA